MPRFGRMYVEACAGKGNVFWAAAKFLNFEKWWINDLQTAPFFEALKDIGATIVVPSFTDEEYEKQKLAFSEGGRQALLLEPYFSFSGFGFRFSGRKGHREHPTKPDGYQKTLRSCHETLRRTNVRISGLDFKYMNLEELGKDDFVYFDLPYLSGNVKTYSPETVDFAYLFRLLESAKFKWLLSEYPESVYFEHFGDPFFVKDVRLLCSVNGEKTVRTECLWKNY